MSFQENGESDKMSLLIVAETLLLDFYVNGCRKWVRV